MGRSSAHQQRRAVGTQAKVGRMTEGMHAAGPMMKCRLAANSAAMKMSASSTVA
jgi:hypothetical protein